MDKKVMVLILSLFAGSVLYQVTMNGPRNFPVQSSPQVEQSVAVVDCLDCMETAPSSCELEVNECLDAQDCTSWMSCIDDCVQLQEGIDCYDDCDIAHSDSHSECTSMKSCMCDVCVGQCTDMCMADQ